MNFSFVLDAKNLQYLQNILPNNQSININFTLNEPDLSDCLPDLISLQHREIINQQTSQTQGNYIAKSDDHVITSKDDTQLKITKTKYYLNKNDAVAILYSHNHNLAQFFQEMEEEQGQQISIQVDKSIFSQIAKQIQQQLNEAKGIFMNLSEINMKKKEMIKLGLKYNVKLIYYNDQMNKQICQQHQMIFEFSFDKVFVYGKENDIQKFLNSINEVEDTIIIKMHEAFGINSNNLSSMSNIYDMMLDYFKGNYLKQIKDKSKEYHGLQLFIQFNQDKDNHAIEITGYRSTVKSFSKYILQYIKKIKKKEINEELHPQQFKSIQVMFDQQINLLRAKHQQSILIDVQYQTKQTYNNGCLQLKYVSNNELLIDEVSKQIQQVLSSKIFNLNDEHTPIQINQIVNIQSDIVNIKKLSKLQTTNPEKQQTNQTKQKAIQPNQPSSKFIQNQKKITISQDQLFTKIFLSYYSEDIFNIVQTYDGQLKVNQQDFSLVIQFDQNNKIEKAIRDLSHRVQEMIQIQQYQCYYRDLEFINTSDKIQRLQAKYLVEFTSDKSQYQQQPSKWLANKKTQVFIDSNIKNILNQNNKTNVFIFLDCFGSVVNKTAQQFIKQQGIQTQINQIVDQIVDQLFNFWNGQHGVLQQIETTHKIISNNFEILVILVNSDDRQLSNFLKLCHQFSYQDDLVSEELIQTFSLSNIKQKLINIIQREQSQFLILMGPSIIHQTLLQNLLILIQQKQLSYTEFIGIYEHDTDNIQELLEIIKQSEESTSQTIQIQNISSNVQYHNQNDKLFYYQIRGLIQDIFDTQAEFESILNTSNKQIGLYFKVNQQKELEVQQIANQFQVNVQFKQTRMIVQANDQDLSLYLFQLNQKMSNIYKYPENWKLPQFNYIQVEQVQKDSNEYQNLKNIHCLNQLNILSVHHIQNLYLWQNYCYGKESLINKNTNPNEKLLIYQHNITLDYNIIYQDKEEGFDSKFQNQQNFIQFSNQIDLKLNTQQIMIARVLIGDPYLSKELTKLQKPPKKTDQISGYYDSVCIEENQKLIYQIYKNYYAYPQYLITIN